MFAESHGTDQACIGSPALDTDEFCSITGAHKLVLPLNEGQMGRCGTREYMQEVRLLLITSL